MKALYSSISILIAAAFVVSGCSQNNIAQTEVDDMYFTFKDRDALEASTKIFTDNFTREYEEPLTEDEAEEYSEINYSSKTINPEYIAKYSSEKLTGEELETESEYFDEEYSEATKQSEESGNYYIRNNYYGWPSYSNYNPYSVWSYDPWFYTSPFRYGHRPYGSRLSVTLSWGWGSGWYRPYSFYDPFWGYGYYARPYRYRYFDPFYDPWYYSGVSSWYGYGYSGGYGFYCPTRIYYSSSDRVYVSRSVTRGPRVARGVLNDGQIDRQYRGTGDGRFIDDGSVTVRDNNTNARTTGPRNNYYRRTRTSTDDAVTTRGYQRRTSTNNTNVDLNTRRSSNTGYTRSSNTHYRTRSTGNTSRYSNENSTRTYRRSSVPSFNRSTNTRSNSSFIRSTSGSRSSGATRSYSPGSRSGSRSSGTPSRGSSRSGSSSRRGGN